MNRANNDPSQIRRQLIKFGLSGTALSLSNTLLAFQEAPAHGQLTRIKSASLIPQRDARTGLDVLKLPREFRYHSLLWTGESMTDGSAVPDRPDGMACFAVAGKKDVVLVRNHERAVIKKAQDQGIIGTIKTPQYDPLRFPGLIRGMGGGTTTITLADNQVIASEASLAGTLVNCAGGPTPWGSWLSCEEIELRASMVGGKDHGYVFEVPSDTKLKASGKPIKAMGFMRHEAAAVGADGVVYLTEDNGSGSGFYRFLPADRRPQIGALEQGGRLEMLKVRAEDARDLRRPKIGERFAVEWVAIDKPDADPESMVAPMTGMAKMMGQGRSGPFLQGMRRGGAQFGRLEGCWQHNGAIYFTDTSGGEQQKGVVWLYQPAAGKKNAFHEQGELIALFVSPDEATADNIDNITLSPHGGIILCEDGGGRKNSQGKRLNGTRLLSVNHGGEVMVIAENNLVITDKQAPKGIAAKDYRNSEFAGACFDPSGTILYVNIQVPGVLLAIEGPWQSVLV